MTSDCLYIDDFIIDVRDIANWLKGLFDEKAFSDTCVKQLKKWLTEEGIFHEYKCVMPGVNQRRRS